MTLPQVHRATNALIASWRLPPAARRCGLEHTAKIISHWQHRNQQARTSHTKTRLKELEIAGINVEKLQR